MRAHAIEMSRGKFITFEGGEGSGKSTQALQLQAYLAGKGIASVFTREPGGTPFAEAVRNFLLFGAARTAPGTPFSEALLFYSARADHVERKIQPALREGTWVVCDRFSDSTRAYQGAAGGVPAATLLELERIVLGGLKPDLTFVLDLPAEAGLKRAEARRLRELAPQSTTPERDLFEDRDVEFHERLRQGFLNIANAEPQRCVVIDATQPIDAISGQVEHCLVQRLGPL